MRGPLYLVLFLFSFLSAYGFLHAYVYRKFRKCFMLGGPAGRAVAAFFLLMTVSPVLVNLFARAGFEGLTVVFSYVGYTWMAAVFLLFCTHGAIDVLGALTNLISRTGLRFGVVNRLVNGYGRIPAFLIVPVILVYGVFEARTPRIELVMVETAKLPVETLSFTVAQISDVHFSAINGEGKARIILEALERIEPDVLVSTGDLVDRGLLHPDRVEALFRSLEIPFGKYAVTGNHEFYVGLDDALRFTMNAGFRVLRNEAVEIGDWMTLVGVDDPAGIRLGEVEPFQEEEILARSPRDRMTVLLKHRPDVHARSLGLFDLQLSGHTHKGQIFPFTWVTRWFYPYTHGFFSLDQGSRLYVNRGTGTFGPPIRFLAPPEITVIRFVPEMFQGVSPTVS